MSSLLSTDLYFLLNVCYNYESNLDRRMSCVWVFDAGTSAATIVFDIQEILIENSRRCSFDSITFYEGLCPVI